MGNRVGLIGIRRGGCIGSASVCHIIIPFLGLINLHGLALGEGLNCPIAAAVAVAYPQARSKKMSSIQSPPPPVG